MEGLALLAAQLGMPHAFRRDARATLLPLDQHIRFLKEARPGAPLTMSGGVVSFAECEAVVYMELRHGDATPCATFRTRLAHVQAGTLRPFPWAQRTRQAAAGLQCAVPAHGAARSVDIEAPAQGASVALAERLGVEAIGRGAVRPEECDSFGRMRPELFIGRVSDAVPNLLAAWREEVARAATAQDGADRQAGAAVLEYRLAYHAWPEAGDLVETRSAITEVGEKTKRLVHWVLDPVSGKAWCTAEAVAVTFDLITRKTIPIPDGQRRALAPLLKPDMRM
jgi:acyl-CoA thioester hydrolase